MSLPVLAEEGDSKGLLNFYDYSQPVLGELLKDKYGLDTYRIGQLFDWVYSKGVTDFSQMTNLSFELREKLPTCFEFPQAELTEPVSYTHLTLPTTPYV